MQVTVIIVRTVGVYQTYLGIVQRRLEDVSVGTRVFNAVAGQVECLVAVRAREEYCQVEAFVRERIADTISELRFRVSDVGAVFVVDDTVAVAVFVDIVAGSSKRLITLYPQNCPIGCPTVVLVTM